LPEIDSYALRLKSYADEEVARYVADIKASRGIQIRKFWAVQDLKKLGFPTDVKTMKESYQANYTITFPKQ
jgi:hypothetical protein